jgi:tetratricopeptide (TPR) repeat protein
MTITLENSFGSGEPLECGDERAQAPAAAAARLELVETALRCAPDDIALLLEQARCLRELGDSWRARGALLSVLRRDRYQRDAMLALAELAIASGELDAARTILSEAVVRHARFAAAHTALGTVLLEQDDRDAAARAFLTALGIDALSGRAWCGLAVVLERCGNLAAAELAWKEAFREVGPARSIYRGGNEPVRILLLWSAVDGNIPLHPVLDDRVFEWATLFVESYYEGMELPPHDVVINAVGNPDLPPRALRMAQRVVDASTAAVVNDPARVQTTTREAVANRLRGIPGVATPCIASVSRAALAARPAELAEEYGLQWPLLVRSPGFHTGKHFVRVERAAEMNAGLAQLPGDELLLISYLDVRCPDGAFRKYRVMFIDGKLYPLHLAIAREWMVHYFSAEMSIPEHRAEEAAFLNDPARVLGASHVRALEQICTELALDYGGIDFSFDARGRLVIFEANATMTVCIPPAGPQWEYARPAVERIRFAMRDMLVSRARSSASACGRAGQ